MKPTEKIENLIKNVEINTNTDTDKAVLADVLRALENSRKPKPAEPAPGICRIVVKSRIAKAAAVAAALTVGVVIWLNRSSPVENIGRVKNLYGIVALTNVETSRKVMGTAELHPGQWIETSSGSAAEILLADESRLLCSPRTVLQISNKEDGPSILLRQGTLAAEAARQPPGRSLMIETAGSRIRVLGTNLQVRLIKKPDGTRQARVSVASGKVELESAGQKVLLLPNTEGIADEGKTPVRRSLNLEVNEMIRLLNKSNELAAESNRQAGAPAIIEFRDATSATVWTIIDFHKLEERQPGRYLLRLKYPASGVRAFTLEGTELPVSGQGRIVQLDLSNLDIKRAQAAKFILRLPDIKGLFRSEEGDLVQFDRPGGSSAVVALLQFRLPESAYVESIHPEPIEVARKLNKLVITVAADVQTPAICD